MDNKDLVLAEQFCIHHNIEMSFIQSLHENGMIETVLIEKETFVPIVQLPRLEKIIRLHFELQINLEGIETIIHLLDRIESMQSDLARLSNRLKTYEG